MPFPPPVSSIVAQAFRFMEVAPPSSLADDTPEGADAAQQYPVAVRMVLEAVDWSFASVLRQLPAVALPDPAEADAELPHLYALPPDCLILREAGPPGCRWRIDRAGLRADAPAPLRVRYTALVDDETRLPATVQTAIALQLAALLGPRWLTTLSKLEAIEQRLRLTLRQAARSDARHASPEPWADLRGGSDWAAEARR